METIIENFNQRYAEVEKYYKVLLTLDDERVSIIRNGDVRKRKIKLDSDALKVMKSTCFLLLYNLIESSIRESFTYLYEKINSEENSIENYTDEFKKLWLNQHFKNIDPVSSNQATYRTVINSIVEKILNSEDFNMDSELLPISGNIDAQKIRELYKKHNIKLNIHHRAFGGGELRTVKDKRNALAHGNITFSECGREYTVDDLVNIKKRTVIYLRSSLRYMKIFTESRKYAV
ncbi:MAE_28990/MAE_18760 family HEPN-like nuclease [Marinifilum fragile]|uniref:MAE_28990/MAE_18760 family HEPN-like nuclease n=1 Tax=Marinifilum fragile TaxID=570161 RepID=UPI002AA880F4|nr:MAE_28990/MAE_18760 family HEPN-like nuclease [Marinifilum fragile]